MTRFDILLEGYVNDSLKEAELAEFLALMEEHTNKLESGVLTDLQQNNFMGLTDPVQRQKLFHNILETSRLKRKPPIKYITRRMVAAAAIIVALSTGVYYLFLHAPEKSSQTNGKALVDQNTHDIQPDSDGIILTLADGSQIILDSVGNGNIAQEGDMEVIKLANGELSYTPARSSLSAGTTATGDSIRNIPRYNTLTIPRGKQFRLILPDGSKVWLNAASSIRYPIAFAGTERKVEITGEVYFEVKPLPLQKTPFIVDIFSPSGETAAGRIEVLGTHFNINAYADEGFIRATLIEGSIKLAALRHNKHPQAKGTQPSNYDDQRAQELQITNYRLLSPGQQGQLAISLSSHKPSPIKVESADIEQVMAWKNGLFDFKDANIQEIMHQAARWYDVDIVFEGPVSNENYKGKISRNATLEELIRILENNGIKLTREGRKIIVHQ